MPELPDVTVYIEALRERTLGQPLLKARLSSPFVLRTFEPPLRAAEGRRVAGIERLGKRIVLRLASGEGPAARGGDLFLNGDHIAHPSVIGFRPAAVAIGGIDQLHRYSKLIA